MLGLGQIAIVRHLVLAEWAEQTTAKQRITGSRVHTQLVAEGYAVGTTVRGHLRARRRQAA